MDGTTYASRLRYLDAKDVDDSVVKFEGLNVRGTDGAKLGDLDGFIVDAASGRILYSVVDSGGWFRSHRFLLPIGHATVDREARALHLDIGREALNSYPDFDEKRFQDFTDEDFRAYDASMAASCCPEDEGLNATSAIDDRRHYQQPNWWTPNAYLPERLRPVEPRPYETRSTP